MNCLVCNQETARSEAEYCPSHLRAFDNVMLAFEKWTVAFEELTPLDFLQRMQRAPGIGPKAKEIALYFSEYPLRWKQ